MTRFTRDEFQELSETLSHELHWKSPLDVSSQIRGWEQYSTFQTLERENATFKFMNRELPIRVFVAQFLDFQADKLLHPEVIVWPGAFTGTREHALPLETVIGIFSRRQPLFVDVPGGEVRPVLLVGREHDAIHETFNAFYAYSASYQLVRQWHVTSGPFDLDFGWLGPTGETLEAAMWAANIFENAFGRAIHEFEILAPNGELRQ